MISLEAYKVVHLFGVFLILMSLGALSFYLINGGVGKPSRKAFLGMAHGLGLLLAIVGGFGMLARLGIMGSFPGWVIGKLLIWLVLGAMPVVIRKQPRLAGAFWWVTALLGATAAWLALFKPF